MSEEDTSRLPALSMCMIFHSAALIGSPIRRVDGDSSLKRGTLKAVLIAGQTDLFNS